MTRPSQHTDKLLIEAAKILIREKGISGLKVREAAKKAGVNLGMFHYHFKSKDQFVKRVLKETYEDFFASFTIETGQGGTPLERLKRALLSIAKFARLNRPIALAIVSDLMRGHQPTVEFTLKNFTKHIFVTIGLVRECQSKGYIVKVPLPQAAVFLVGSIIFPTGLVGVLEKAGPGAGVIMGMARRYIEDTVLSDDSIEQRVDWALQALSKKKKEASGKRPSSPKAQTRSAPAPHPKRKRPQDVLHPPKEASGKRPSSPKVQDVLRSPKEAA